MFTTFMHLDPFAQLILIGVIIVAIVSFIYSWWLRQDVMKQDTGTDEMKEVWSAIKEGADAYLWKQLKTILPIVVILTGALFLSVYLVHPSKAAEDEFAAIGLDPVLMIAIGRTVAFILGASFSLMVGQFGMRIAVHGNLRVAAAAAGATDENGKLLDVDRRYNKALSIAYHAGTVTGMLTDGFGLLGGTAIFIAFGTAAPDALLGFGFGGTILALFMRVGGGIYTKAADVGADLVGKVEKDIPEDDPRNAAVIADLVGDNVGDCAGMAADIFESYEVTIVSSLILGLFLFELSGGIENGEIIGDLVWIMYPLIVRGIGVISSIVGTFAVALWKTPDAEKAMFQSYELSSAITIATSALFAIFYVGDWRLALLIATGVMLAVSFNPITARFTSKERGPVKEVVDSMHGGPATTILSGLALGYESSVWAVVAICVSFVISVGTFLFLPGNELVNAILEIINLLLNSNFGVSELFISADQILQYMLYGIALIGIGMLSHTGNNVAMDSFGPISDNAQGIAEMTSMDKESASVLEELDAVGNTTKAITKGIAIASAVIAAVSLFASFVTDVQVVVDNLQEAGIQITNPLINGLRVNIPAVFVGLLLGSALPWIFAAFNIRAVSRAAGDIIEEVRRQFKIPGIMEGTKKPDYERAVSISTSAAQKELVSLAVIAVSIPIIVGIIFGAMIIAGIDILAADLDTTTRETILSTIGSGVEVLGGFQAGIIASGQLLAVFMANAGGAWDNAKKAVEDEPRNIEENMGKGSERHKAGVVGDTVGDPLKDTAGPAVNPMIKVVNLISLILAPLLVEASVDSDLSFLLVVVAIVLFVLFIWAYRKSNRKVSPLAL
ncbi:MAG: sodium-translocating pyrophosphatase [Candidatus Heimdallarchaeota archaeon]|nr:MAG: sodium-translocating pyrophosphatase [Candidatus Heimdallarchaeota archaeon]